jgi:arylsulfatase A-like enzyme
LTGKYINNIGMQDGAIAPGENRTLSKSFTLLPEVLREEGYR